MRPWAHELMSLSMEVRGSARKKGDSSGCLNTTFIFRFAFHYMPLHGIAPHHTWVPVLWYQTGVESARLSPLMK